jgi:flagellar hook assembly protein FlgD
VLALEAPRPNPAGGTSRFDFSLSRAGFVKLELFGASGARVRTLLNAELGAGAHESNWDGRDDQGRRLAPGLYFARLTAEGQRLTRLVSRVN